MIEASQANLFFAVCTILILRVDLVSRKQANVLDSPSNLISDCVGTIHLAAISLPTAVRTLEGVPGSVHAKMISSPARAI